MRNFSPTPATLRRGASRYLPLLALLLAAAPLAAQAQTGGVGIGTTAPDVSAALDIVSSSKGALLPRVADATALATPATGLLVFQTGGTAGFYYNAGTPSAPSWQRLVPASGPDYIQNTTTQQAGSNFSISGNGLVGGRVGIGTSSPGHPLTVQAGATGLALGFNSSAGTDKYNFSLTNGGLNLSESNVAAGRLFVQDGGSVGIGTTAPDMSAALDIVSSSKGALLPRLPAAGRLALAAPAPGLLLYQTDAPAAGAAGAGTAPGFWYNGGTAAAPAWLRLTDSNGVRYDPATGLQVGPEQAGTVGTVGTPGGTSGTGYMYPYRGYWQDSRSLFLYRASLLTAAGLHAGPITQLELDVAVKGSGRPYQNFTIQLANTTATVVPATFPAAGTMTTVHTSTHTTVVGWNAHPCNAGSFSWDGTSNLLVQVCYDNTGFSYDDEVNTVAAGYVAAYGVAADNTAGCTLTTNAPNASAVSPNTSLPVARFTQTGSYALPPFAGTAGQVLTQQGGGAVAFQNPQWTQSGTSLYPFNPASNVGIGTGTPTQKLHVAGQIYSSTGGIRFPDNTVQATAAIATASNGLTRTGDNLTLGGTLTQATNIAQAGYVLSLTGGSLGINTRNPSGLLTVQSNAVGGAAVDQQQLAYNRAGGGADNWQSFTAGITGNLTQVDLELSSPTNANGAAGTLSIYAGTGTGGTLLASQPVTYNNSGIFQQYPLVSSVAVVAGQVYTLRFQTPTATVGWVHYSNTNPYAGGRSDAGSSLDAVFKTYVSEALPALTALADGKVGIGTSSPDARLQVAGVALVGNGGALPATTNATGIGWNSIYTAGESEFYNYRGAGNGGFRFFSVPGTAAPVAANQVAQINGSTGMYSTLSDRRVKTNIAPLAQGLRTVLALRPVSYDFHPSRRLNNGVVTFLPDDKPVRALGFVAQELDQVLPEAVERPADARTGFYTVSYSTLVPVLTQAIQEQQQQIEALKQQNAALNTRAATAETKAAQATATLETFEARLRRLEAATGGQAQR